MGQRTKQTFLQGIFLKKLEIELPYDLAIPLLGIHTEETRSERDTCTPMFIAALFIIARTWKQSRCPSANEWIRKLWYIYIMEYYSAIKKNSFESVLMRCMKQEPIIQSEVIQKDKDQYSILMHINVNPGLIHVNVWQKPLQYCEVISLQLIKINEKNEKIK